MLLNDTMPRNKEHALHAIGNMLRVSAFCVVFNRMDGYEAHYSLLPLLVNAVPPSECGTPSRSAHVRTALPSFDVLSPIPLACSPSRLVLYVFLQVAKHTFEVIRGGRVKTSY